MVGRESFSIMPYSTQEVDYGDLAQLNVWPLSNPQGSLGTGVLDQAAAFVAGQEQALISSLRQRLSDVGLADDPRLSASSKTQPPYWIPDGITADKIIEGKLKLSPESMIRLLINARILAHTGPV